MILNNSTFSELPNTRDELISLALSSNANREDIYLREDANVENFRKGLQSSSRRLVIASHAFSPFTVPDINESGLLLSESDEEKFIFASEIAQLDIEADWVVLSACNTDLKNPNISFETIPEQAQIGFPINHKVVINDLGELFTLDSVAWEDSSAWLSDSSKVFIKESNIDTLNNSISLNYQITFWDTGSVSIPPLYAFVSFPDSLESTILKTDSSFVYISSVLDTTMTTVIPDKPLKEIKFPIERLRLFALFILFILILFTFYLIRNRYKERISKRQFFNFNPRSKALKDVEKIDLKTDSPEFFAKISEVLKKYFQNNF